MKMVQKWMQTLVLLFFCQETLQLSSLTEKTDGERVEITCAPVSKTKSNMVIWFRVQDNAGMEFIASFSTKDGMKKTYFNNEVFSEEQIKKNILILKAFKKARDSGVYSCASINGNALVFGEVTRLAGPAPMTTTTTTTTPMTTTIELTSSTTAKSCKVGKVDPTASCDLIVWAPLTAGCGFLFLLLIITVCHCNRIRTKRCPHHYKRQPRMATPGQQHPIANNRLF
ncbi:T-cell surface glycoprotein CD8 alpha chain [Oncorhynchus tshawytscha]|uniref:T-cell surface glycoprotein CD8 alpha chain n=1 Tax=Oncorhynchus tshawytscha TaxID=74940 RepID=UPI000D09F34B|nr:T-cell surface glycoprotein CD8 alpha chain [Oncorhynchus tshawytscha]